MEIEVLAHRWYLVVVCEVDFVKNEKKSLCSNLICYLCSKSRVRKDKKCPTLFVVIDNVLI